MMGRGVAVELSVVAPGLFRIRAHAGTTLPQSSSWAVVDQPQPSAIVSVHTAPGSVSLRTPDASLTWSLSDSSWVLESGGLELFRSKPASMGFASGSAQLALALHDREAIFGLGESTGSFNKRGLIREFWNIDVLGHAPAIHPSLRNLYVSIPFALSLRDGRAAGLFWDNPARQTWDMGQTRLDEWKLTAANGEIDLYLFVGPTVHDVVGGYTRLTGRIPMPPRWSLGYQQCRYSYETAARVEQVAREFRERKIPCDVLYLDIHHMDAYRVFTFGKGFPKPTELMQRLRSDGFRVVTIVDPGVKDEARFGVLKRGIAADAFVKNADGESDFIGEVWPGKSRYPDFLRPETRTWWALEQAALTRQGVAGFWNDMNEPSNFARPDKTLAPDAIHRTERGTLPHIEAHNLYGMQMARASREGSLAAAPDQRPFVITRATYAGGQRDAVVWTGDNSSHWDHLRDSVQMLLNLGVSGVAVCGGDVGGFLDNTTPELFVRWLQFAAFTPFFRNHSNLGTIDQEPWALGPTVESIARRTIEQRYQLLQLFYCLTAEACETGAPIVRPLFWHYPNDPIATARGDQFLLGRDLLVAPVLEQGSTARAVYLPNETWYDFWTDELIEGGQHHLAEAPLERIPIFVRGGAILPIIEAAAHSGAQDLTAITLNVWPGLNDGFDWYEDDGETQAFERGDWHRRRLRLSRKGSRLTLELGAATGSRPSAVKVWRVVLHGIRGKARVMVDGQLADVLRVPEDQLIVLEIDNRSNEIRVSYGPV